MATDRIRQNYDWSVHFESGGPQFVGSTLNTGGGSVNFAANNLRMSNTPSIHSMFKVSDYEGQKNSNPDRVIGTCEWFLQHDRYRRWCNSTIDDLLWVSADPGCGKSVLSKFLIENELRSTESVSTCYFFFKDDKQQGSLQSALCGLLHQLFTHKGALLRHALKEYERNGSRLFIEPLLLWRLLITAGTDPAAGHVICILDALDECKEGDRHNLIDLFKSFYKQSSIAATRQSNLKFLVTSRPYSEIEVRFQELVHEVPTIRLAGEEESKTIGQEIQLVIKNKVDQIAIGRQLEPRVRDMLKSKLLSIPNQTYLWLHLIFEEIQETFDSTKRQLSDIIEKLPDSVYDAYEKILSRSKNEVEARRILGIVIAANRPLKLNEMDVILAIKDDTRLYNDVDLEGEGNIKRRIRNVCGLFLRVSDAKIYLIHQTAKEFLIAEKPENLLADQKKIPEQWRNSFIPRECNYNLALACVKHLSFATFESGDFVKYIMDRCRLHQNWDHILMLAGRYQFLEYSATQWGAHVRNLQLEDEDEVALLSLSLCDVLSQQCKIWSTIYYKYEKLKFGLVTDFTSLHIACLVGIERVVRSLLDRGADINNEGTNVENALQVASGAGHLAVVQLLLNEGANFRARGKHGSALEMASEYGHEKIVQLLLEHETDIDVQHGRESRALVAASRNGHEEVVRLLLKNGTKIDTRSREYDEALRAALRHGHEATFQLLLEKGGDLKTQAERYITLLQVASFYNLYKVVERLTGFEVDIQGGKYSIALQAASHENHERIVKLLLTKGADIKTLSGKYGTALQAASYAGRERIVKLLLTKGADINTRGGKYGTALQAASYSGHEMIAKLLLTEGADINAQGGEYDTALQAASYSGHKKLVELLLTKGANINAQGGQYGTALQTASHRGYETIVKLLLTEGANINAQGGQYGTALQAALNKGHERIVELLFNKGADTNARGGEYDTALQAASYRGHKRIVELLLTKGADINAQGGQYGTALQAALYRGHERIMKLLLTEGADVNAQGGQYGTALQAALYRGHERIVKLLLTKDADVNAQGGQYGTALQAASYEGYETIVGLLLTEGADFNAQGGQYGTALQAASYRGHEKIVELLLTKGADINAQGGQYGTALQAALSAAHENIVELLLTKGADASV